MEQLYRFLESIGYGHPIHPPLAHMPVGLVVGAFFFIIAGRISRRPDMRRTALHCAVLALIFMVPTVALGVTDWLHFYEGAWIEPIIIKFVMTAVLFILLAAAIILERRKRTGFAGLFLIYLLCTATVTVLGFYGAQLVYAEKPAPEVGLQQGERLYAAHCAACHPNGGNVINPKLPVLNSPKLKDVDTFIKFNRNPISPEGAPGGMPAFPKDKLSDNELKQIYEYLMGSLSKQGK